MRPWPGSLQTKTRPSWWTAEKVLSLLQDGEPAPALCHRASAECGGKVKPSTLRADISKWTETASLGEQFRAALALWKPDGMGGQILRTDWHEEFYAALELANGEIPLACEYACVGEAVVLARMDRRNKCYDRDFTERVRILEGMRLSKVRENVLKEAESDAKIGLRVLEAALPDLHGSKQTVEHTGRIEHEHGLAREVIEASAARTKTMMAGRERLLPEMESSGGRVIDITPRVRVVEKETG